VWSYFEGYVAMSDAHESSETFPVTSRNKLTRRPDRASYDRASVYAILDAALIAHIAYNVEGQPYCTPTVFWRNEDRLYWHGSVASRMTRFQAPGLPVCLTVTHLDAIVLARSARHHSINYRSVMAFGVARLVADADEKRHAIDGFIDRLVPGRAATLRPPTQHDIRSTSFIAMDIEQASGKTRSLHVNDEAEDYDLPIWAARIPVKQLVGEPEVCPRQLPGVPVPEGMNGYCADRRLDDALLEAYRFSYR
jgi:nitroimidazol reductase NimA-like FMN-containing flavoprotein (pyridoxamine 5'-phosphate oxidase superfamily)